MESSTQFFNLPPSQLCHPPDNSPVLHQQTEIRLQPIETVIQKQTNSRNAAQRSPNLNAYTEFPALDANSQKKAANPINSYSKSWIDVIRENKSHSSSIQLKYYEPTVKDNIRYAEIDEKLINTAREKWNNSIAFYVYGNKPYYKYLKDYIDRAWHIKGSYQLYTRENGFFIIKLENTDDCDNILTGGPYFYNKKLIFMKKWFPGMKLTREFLHSIPVWIQLPNLDLEFWSVEAISRIASVLGQPVKLDQNTEDMIRISYARILIEIDNNFKFPAEILICCFDGKIIRQKVVYEWVPSICPNCKIFGHTINSCTAKKAWRQKGADNQNSQMDLDSSTPAKSTGSQDDLDSAKAKEVNNPFTNIQTTRVPGKIIVNNTSSIQDAVPFNTEKSSSDWQKSGLQYNMVTENQFAALNSVDMETRDDTDQENDNQDLYDNINYVKHDESGNNKLQSSSSLPETEKLNPSEDNINQRMYQQSKQDHLQTMDNLKSNVHILESEDNSAQDINMEDQDFSTASYKQKRNKINLNACKGDEVIIEGEPFVESNPKWNNLVAQLKARSKNKKFKEDSSSPGGVKSKGISKK